jgi:hypothetical protein
MAPQTKILQHPDKEEIIAQLVNGTPVRDVAEFLRLKYTGADNAHLRVSFSTIQNFKKSYLDIDGQVARDVREAAQDAISRQRLEDGQEVVAETSAYRKKINEIVDGKLDVQRELLKIFTLLDSRIEHFYNLLSNYEFPNAREERVFQGYIDQLIKLVESYKKYVEGYSESVEHNININVMNDQINVVREAVRKSLEDTSPDLAIKFMDNLNKNMKTLEYGGSAVAGHILGEAVISERH